MAVCINTENIVFFCYSFTLSPTCIVNFIDNDFSIYVDVRPVVTAVMTVQRVSEVSVATGE